MSSFMTSSPVVLPSEISKVNDAAEPALLNDKILQPSAQELVTMSATVCDATWSEENEKIIHGPMDYLRNAGGSAIRTQLILAFNEWLMAPKDQCDLVLKIVDMLQNASLLLDDIEDGSLRRRGVPVAHSVFGIAQTINSANYACFQALEEVKNFPDSLETFSILINALLDLHRGQGIEMHWRETFTCPTEESYLQASRGKTGGLMLLAVQLLYSMSPNKNFQGVPDILTLVDTIGVIYQVSNDYSNLRDDADVQIKGSADDITEGKFSFPIIHCINSSPYRALMLNILRQKPQDLGVKQYAIQCLEQAGSFDYCRLYPKNLFSKAKLEARKVKLGERGENAVMAFLENLEKKAL